MFFTPPPPPQPLQPPIVTVWVHGTKPDEHLSPLVTELTKNVSDLLCGSTEKGLHKIAQLSAYHYPFLRAKTLAIADPITFNTEHFYTFGWSGKLTPQARKNAAHDLFYELKKLIRHYEEKYECTPLIILISHSHGGNVILHLAEVIDPDGFELNIAKAILLACPVQKHTAHLINSPIFTRIYSLHSHTDIFQIVDPQGLHTKKKISKPLLSARHFDAHPRLAQALVRWKKCPLWQQEDYEYHRLAMKGLIRGINAINYIKKNRGLFHVEFHLLPFLRQLPSIINHLDTLFASDSNCPSHKDDDIIIAL